MPVFPESFVEEVRQRTDIVDVVSQYVPLKRAGKNLKGLCPFHAEKTASFNVSPERQIFHCFGCGQGGDVFKFLMLYEKMGFGEAIAALAARAGLPLPQRGSSAESEERGVLLRIHQEASRFFQEQLRQTPAGKRAQEYLGTRGLDPRTLELYGFGYAPESWSGLLDYLGRRGVKPELVNRAGLAVARSTGTGHYDRFRGRVMIPIRNESGKVVAFGGRILGSGEPKYLNSPESPIYAKSRILFDFDRAKGVIRERGFAILVEGYLDCIQAQQAGFANTVAACGTALTAAQARLIRRYTQEVVVAFDPDAAGAAATRRGIDLLLEEGFEVKVLELPAGEDPDSFIRRRGARAFSESVDRRLPFLDYLIEQAATRCDLSQPRGRQAFLDEVLPTVARISNDIERAGYVEPLARRARISDQLVLDHLRREVMARRSKVTLPAELAARLTDAERDLILWAFHRPSETAAVLGEIEEEDCAGLLTANLLRALRELSRPQSPGDRLSVDVVLGRLEQAADRSLLTGLAARPDPVNPRQSPRDCLNSLRRDRYRRELNQLQAEIERGVDDDTFARLSAAKLELRRRMESLV
jgi:DNA primase